MEPFVERAIPHEVADFMTAVHRRMPRLVAVLLPRVADNKELMYHIATEVDVDETIATLLSNMK